MRLNANLSGCRVRLSQDPLAYLRLSFNQGQLLILFPKSTLKKRLYNLGFEIRQRKNADNLLHA